jgi:Cd2+/Zn2+-exporting ATPase
MFSAHDIQNLIHRNSNKIAKRYHHATIPIDGMDCSDCAIVLEHGLSRVEGVLQVSASYADQDLWIEYDAHHVRRNTIAQHVRRMGYDVPRTGFHRILYENQSIILSLLSGVFLLLGWTGQEFFNLSETIIVVAYSISYALGGLPLARHAFHHLFQERSFDTDQLMLAAAIGAAILGHWSEGALLLFLFSFGHALEGRAMERARKAISALASLTPRTARVLRDGEEKICPIEQIILEDRVLILPGARIPVDGIVQAGASSIDISSITGEPLPAETRVGDQVFAGSINGEGALEVEATRLAQDSTMAKVIQLVQKAQAQKSATEQVSQKIIKILVPSILIGDLLLIVLPPLFGVPFSQSFLMAMTLLVAASPCALALGTPSAILAGLARAAQKGVLVKGGAHLENMGRLQAIAFDKTGTITIGKPQVTDVLQISPFSKDDVIKWAASAEARSAHPIAQAIVKEAEEREITLLPADDLRSETGLGVQATIGEDSVWVGRAKWDAAEKSSLVQEFLEKLETLEELGKTFVMVRHNDLPIGVIAVADQIRPEVEGTISHLEAIGLHHMLMLTGDNRQSAAVIAKAVGLENVHADLMPEDKLNILRDWTAIHQTTAMVGDGVNDAPALANATVGIAMGGARTQVALETADVVLMADDLSKLPFAIGLGQQTTKIIKQNFVIALGVIAGLILLTLLNLTGIGLAILLHEGSTVLVVFNSLRLLRYRHSEALP